MDEDDTDDIRETITLMNRLTAKITTKSATKFTSKASQILRMQDSAEDSDTMECASENEVENLPRDEDALQLTKTRDRMYERSGYSLDIPEDVECVMARKKTTVSSLRVASDDAKYSSSRLGFFMVAHRSPQSSSSQEEYEPEVKSIPRLQMQQQCQQQQKPAVVEELPERGWPLQRGLQVDGIIVLVVGDARQLREKPLQKLPYNVHAWCTQNRDGRVEEQREPPSGGEPERWSPARPVCQHRSREENTATSESTTALQRVLSD